MQDNVTPKVHQLARRLIEYETEITTPVHEGDHNSPAFRVCEKFRPSLSRLAGAAGFRSLLSRALALAGNEVRWLKAIHIAADGSLEGLDETLVHVSPREIGQGEIELVAQLIGLLVMFIGEELVLQLLLDAWPDGAFDDLTRR